MKKLVSAIVIAVGLAGAASVVRAEPYPADNSGKNARDRSGAAVTSGNQSNDKGDLKITQTIRKAVVSDKALSTYAHNVKIVTNGGVVVLRGPVKSDQEKATIAAKAMNVHGVRSVDNQLEIASQ